MLSFLPVLALAPLAVNAAYTATYTPGNLPDTTETGQTGTNNCGADSQSSMCQNAYLNSLDDFCLWAPPTAGVTIGNSEEYEVSWCTAAGHGTRRIPEGAITAAHYLETPHYIQITGSGDFTKMNIAAGDEGGELDPHGATGNGNPVGGLVFNNGVQIHEWTSFMSDSEFCFRICKDASDAWLWCQHIYDVMGCAWNEPGNYDPGFSTCEGDSTESPPGIYVVDGKSSTFQQGSGATPSAHAAGASSNCQTQATLALGGTISAAATTSATSSSVVSSASGLSSGSGVSSGASSGFSTAISANATSSAVSTASSAVSSSVNSTSSVVESSTQVSSSTELSSSSIVSNTSTSTLASSTTRSVVTVLSTAQPSSTQAPSAQGAAVESSSSAPSASPTSGAKSLATSTGLALLAVACGVLVFV